MQKWWFFVGDNCTLPTMLDDPSTPFCIVSRTRVNLAGYCWGVWLHNEFVAHFDITEKAQAVDYAAKVATANNARLFIEVLPPFHTAQYL